MRHKREGGFIGPDGRYTPRASGELWLNALADAVGGNRTPLATLPRGASNTLAWRRTGDALRRSGDSLRRSGDALRRSLAKMRG